MNDNINEKVRKLEDEVVLLHHRIGELQGHILSVQGDFNKLYDLIRDHTAELYDNLIEFHN